jgi:hypothetical protein
LGPGGGWGMALLALSGLPPCGGPAEAPSVLLIGVDGTDAYAVASGPVPGMFPRPASKPAFSGKCKVAMGMAKIVGGMFSGIVPIVSP